MAASPDETWDSEKLILVVQQDQRAADFFEELAERDRSPSVTKVQNLRKYGFTRREARQLLERLAQCNCGQFVLGRRGYSTRLVWRFRAVDIASDLLGWLPPRESGTQADEDEERDHSKSDDSELDVHDDDNFRRLHTFCLRPDFKVEFRLPADLSADEALRLALFLLTQSDGKGFRENLDYLASLSTPARPAPKDSASESAGPTPAAPNPPSDVAGLEEDFSMEFDGQNIELADF